MVLWSNRVRKDDPAFGSMLYMGDKLQYWEGKAHFVPAGTEIEVFIDGTPDDNMDDQHQFFELVCANWSQWSVPIIEKVRLQFPRTRKTMCRSPR